MTDSCLFRMGGFMSRWSLCWERRSGEMKIEDEDEDEDED